MFDLDGILEKSYRKELLAPSEIKELCHQLKALLMQEGNVRQVSSPVTGTYLCNYYTLLLTYVTLL